MFISVILFKLCKTTNKIFIINKYKLMSHPKCYDDDCTSQCCNYYGSCP